MIIFQHTSGWETLGYISLEVSDFEVALQQSVLVVWRAGPCHALTCCSTEQQSHLPSSV